MTPGETHSTTGFSCNLCSSNKARQFVTVRGYSIVKCAECGLMAVPDPPDSHELSAWYDEAYYTGGNELVYQDYLGEADARKANFRARIKGLRRFFVKPGRLIEVGAAYGLFMEVAKEEGWTPVGVELSPISSQYAREQLGLDVITADLETIPVQEHFDLAVGWDVVEHLPNPMRALKLLNRHLRMGGVVALSTGNAACIGVRLYGARWHLFGPPWHLYYFNLKTLRAMLSKAGFQILQITHEGNPFFNHPVHSGRDRILSALFCNRWSNYVIQRIVRHLGHALAFTAYARKVEEVRDAS
jgi:2-polyprenyl-3-methyl-5-hydroxy-6-metoxy-1,4-benzoquinol methylase